ncbi:MAG TPA: glycoside hydrolase family 57 protein [Terriglobales bacterium]|nr:glycoside hydrolase family 57 protein [Terriglobales bacterium]
MPAIRLIFLWHMHQPFYKDLVTGEYRLPWVRMHALKDYYGMVKLLDEFPTVHQNFNLVPSLLSQIEDYVAGRAKDMWRDLVLKPARELSREEQIFALRYFFQANHTQQIARYPRYFELLSKRAAFSTPEAAVDSFVAQDFADLQVLSQLAWFDEFFLDETDAKALVKKGRNFTSADQEHLKGIESRILAAIIPTYRTATDRGAVELSTTAFYHPILPLLCDSNNGRVSTPGLPLPRRRFLQASDALEQMRRAIAYHERTFGRAPAGMWPSEGSVSNDVIALARQNGLKWLATDEGVLGRSTQSFFERNSAGHLSPDSAQRLYRIYRNGDGQESVFLFFRDHNLSDLIGFVYSGMPAKDAAEHFIRSVKASAQPVLATGRDAVVSIILDGENAWEHFPKSGREFLRRLYNAIASDPQIEPVTISEAIQRTQDSLTLPSLVPGSWINANFNVWIGAPEDNLAWDYLAEARDFYTHRAADASAEKQQLAYEELLIAEGSDWNWWYGPEHHSANDGDFDELYRNHLANVYRLLGANPPDYLHHPISTEFIGKARTVPQTAFIRPRIDSPNIGYFDWLGAATLTADRRGSAMHGKQFLIERAYAGIDGRNFFFRLDLLGELHGDHIIETKVEVLPASIEQKRKAFTVRFVLAGKMLVRSELSGQNGSGINGTGKANPNRELKASFEKVLRAKLPLLVLGASLGDTLLFRFAIFRDQLPLDSLPAQGWMELPIIGEEQMLETGDQVW